MFLLLPLLVTPTRMVLVEAGEGLDLLAPAELEALPITLGAEDLEETQPLVRLVPIRLQGHLQPLLDCGYLARQGHLQLVEQEVLLLSLQVVAEVVVRDFPRMELEQVLLARNRYLPGLLVAASICLIFAQGLPPSSFLLWATAEVAEVVVLALLLVRQVPAPTVLMGFLVQLVFLIV